MLTRLYTTDEARAAFVASAHDVLSNVAVTDHQLCRLIGGRGRRSTLTTNQKAVVYSHWALKAHLEGLGHGGSIADELEGIISCVEALGAGGASATLDDTLVTANQPIQQRAAA